MKIAVIGSSGGMGSFFVRYLQAKDHEVIGSDIVRPPKGEGLKFVSSASAAARGADAVLIATPIDATAETALEVAPGLKRGSILVDISSIKGKTLPALREISEKSGLVLLSIHPLFGPTLGSTKQMKLAVIEDGKKKNGSMELAKRIFPDAKLFPMDAGAHDRLMAILLSLTHITNIAYAAVVANNLRPTEFKRYATPSSALQMTLAEGILSQDPKVYSYIGFENGFVKAVVANLIAELNAIQGMLEKGQREEFEALFSRLKLLYGADASAIQKVYDIFEA